MNMHRSLVLLGVIAFAFCMKQAPAETLLFDNFEDGSVDDGNPAIWIPGAFSEGDRSVIDGSYILDLDDAFEMTSIVKVPHDDVSIRSQVRFF